MAEEFDEYAEALSYEENYDGGVMFYLEHAGTTQGDDKQQRSSHGLGANLRRCNTEPARGLPLPHVEEIGMTEEGPQKSQRDTDPAPVEEVSRDTARPLKRTNSQKMKLFEEQHRAFQDQYSLLTTPGPPVSSRQKAPLSAGSSRSASMSPTRGYTGLEGLNNLVQLMEHLTELRLRNTNLSQQCASLQDTKSMLQTQLMEAKLGRQPRARYASRARGQGRKKPHSAEPPLAASDGSDTGQGPSSASGFKHHRSHSVGSLDLEDVASLQAKAGQYEDKGPQRLAAKSKKRFSKWSKSVKKAFAGKMENITRRSSTVTVPQDLAAQLKKRARGQLHHTKSADEGMLGMDADDMEGITSTAPLQDGNPPSPDSIKSEPVPDLPSDGEEHEDGEEEKEEEEVEQQPCKEQRNSALLDGALLPSPDIMDDDAVAHSDDENERLRYMQTSGGLRRQSSPNVSRTNLDAELEGSEDDDLQASSPLRRSASFKDSSTRRHITSEEQNKPRKTHRFAWGRVKDMIHVRKSDSLKRKQRSNSEGTELAAPDDSNRRSKSAEAEVRKSMQPCPPTPTSTPQPQRKLMRTHTDTPPDGGSDMESGATKLSSSPLEDKAQEIQALMGGLSEEYTRKMKEWEQKKSVRKSVCKDSSLVVPIDKQGANFSEEFIRKMEEWERKMQEERGLEEVEPPDPDNRSSRQEELQATLSAEFQKTVKEWERLKSKRQHETSSPTFELQMQQAEKEEKSKQREHERDRDRSKHRIEKIKADKDLQRLEKELHKIEQKEIKIEREKQKLVRMKEHLELSSPETSAGYDNRYESATIDSPVKRRHKEGKLELRKNVTSFPEIQNYEAQSISDKSKHSSVQSEGKHSSVYSDSKHSSIISGTKYSSAEGEQDLYPTCTPPSSPSSTSKEDSHPPPSPSMVDDSTSIDLSFTGLESAVSLQNQNNRLQQELAKKRQELVHLQDQVTSLTNKLDNTKRDHNHQIEKYKKELWASSRLGHEAIEKQEMNSYFGDLRSKLDHLRTYGDKLASERATVESQMMEQIKARDAMETKLIAEIRNLQLQLEASQKSDIEDGTEKLYDYILGLQVKLSDLKMGVVERNKLIGEMKRHLLLQEANNLMLEADMARRELELQYFKEARRSGAIKRWKTFTGMDAKYREAMYGSRKKEPSSPGLPTSYKEFEDCLQDLHYGGLQVEPPDLSWLQSAQPLGLDAEIQSLLSKLQAQRENQKKAKEKQKGMEVACQTCDGLLQSQRQSKAVQTCEQRPQLQVPRPMAHIPKEGELSPSRVTSTEGFLRLPLGMTTVPTCSGSSGSLAEQSPKSPKDVEVSFTFTLPNSCLVSSRSSNISAKPRMGISVDTHLGKQRRQWVPLVSQCPPEDGSKANFNQPEYTQSLDRPYKVRSRQRPEGLQRQQAVSPDGFYPIGSVHGTPGSCSVMDSARHADSLTGQHAYQHSPRSELSAPQLSDTHPYSPVPPGGGSSPTTCHPPVRAGIFGRDSPRFSSSNYVYHPKEIKSALKDNTSSTGRPVGLRRREKDKEKVDVKHMINKFETQSSLSDSARETPSPPIKAHLSSVQRLKTASELMHESGSRHSHGSEGFRDRQGSHSGTHPSRSSGPSTSNGKCQSPSVSAMVRQWSGDRTSPVDSGRLSPSTMGSNVQRLIKQLSRETTPDQDQHSRRGSTGSGKGEIIEKTLRKLSDAGLEIPDVPPSNIQMPVSRKSASPPSLTKIRNSPSKELPAEGFVSQRATQFGTQIKNDNNNGNRSTAVIIPVQQAPSSQTWGRGDKRDPTYHSTESKTLGRFRTGRSSRQSHDSTEEKGSTERSRSIASFFFPGKEGRSKKEKKEPKTSKQKGVAVSTLCKQAMSVDVEGGEEGMNRQWTSTEGAIGEVPSSPQVGTPDKRRSKARFFDREWMQKPKRLFRVSNTE